jgi:fumarylpyruvate hydrolase
MFFSKPPDAVCTAETIPFPPATHDLQHEIELVAAIGLGGQDIPEARALDHVFGYAVGIDLTRRDLQREAKQRRQAWDMAKGFDFSAPCSAVCPVEQVGHPEAGAIVLDVNGTRRQTGDLSEQIWSVAQAIAALSSLVTLSAGDLLFMGTPAGVGSVEAGDQLDGRIEPVGTIRVRVGAPQPVD